MLEELGVIEVMIETPSFEDNKSAKIILETPSPGRRKGAKHFSNGHRGQGAYKNLEKTYKTRKLAIHEKNAI